MRGSNEILLKRKFSSIEKKLYYYRKSCYILSPLGGLFFPLKGGAHWREGGGGGANRGFTVPVFRNRQYDDATLRCTSENGVEQHDHHGQRLIAAALDIVLRCRES